MATLENRFIRIEDWKGNVYYPDNSNETSTAGIIYKEAGTEAESDPYTEGQWIADSYANKAKSIFLTSDTTSKKMLFKCSVETVPLGRVVIGPRLKSNIVTGTLDLVKMSAYYNDYSGETPVKTLLATTNISAKMFETASTFATFHYGFEYKGVAIDSKSMIIELEVLPGTNASIWFDQMYVAMELGASGTGSKTKVSVTDREMIIEGDVAVQDRVIIVGS